MLIHSIYSGECFRRASTRLTRFDAFILLGVKPAAFSLSTPQTSSLSPHSHHVLEVCTIVTILLLTSRQALTYIFLDLLGTVI